MQLLEEENNLMIKGMNLKNYLMKVYVSYQQIYMANGLRIITLIGNTN